MPGAELLDRGFGQVDAGRVGEADEVEEGRMQGSTVPASFAAELCGYRTKNANPNTSDNNDRGSVEIGHALFEELGVPADRPDPGSSGSALEELVKEHLRSLRPDLMVGSAPAKDFAQYEHLAAFASFARAVRGSGFAADELVAALEALPPSRERAAALKKARRLARDLVTRQDAVDALLRDTPEESLLKIDVCVAAPGSPRPHLEIALSLKWSLRTDRAQDCISQGSKLVAQRRGRMPHYAVVTMEPRPAMLRIIADGSGAVDCVYHLDLGALERAVKRLDAKRGDRAWNPKLTFDRLVAQRRLRDYDDLVREVRSVRLPAA